MRTTLISLVTCLVLAATATATPYLLSASPNPVHFGQTLTVKGAQWPVIEFCKRTVHLRLTTAQNAVKLGGAHVRKSGRFTFLYKVKQAKIGAGHWTLRAKMNCENGNSGALNPVRKSIPLQIKH